MHIKTIASAIALTTAMAFSGSAMAQTMIGSQAVSEADQERVKVFCEDLQNTENQAVGATGAEDELTETDDASATDDTADTGDDAADGTDDMAAATDDGDSDSAAVGSIDMDLITLENCKDAGFIQ